MDTIIGQNREPPATAEARQPAPADAVVGPQAPEHGGRGDLDPVRYGDWEKNGRCIDF